MENHWAAVMRKDRSEVRVEHVNLFCLLGLLEQIPRLKQWDVMVITHPIKAPMTGNPRETSW